MSEQRNKYDREFKIEAVRLLLESGKKSKEIAEDLGISRDNLLRWRREFERDSEHSFPGKGKMKPQDEELFNLMKELATVKQERDILKKALAIFSRPQR